MRDALGKIKGFSIREFVAWYGPERDGEHVRVVIRGLDANDHAHFDLADAALGILPSSWYPAEVIHRVLDGILRGLSPHEIDALAQAGGAATVRSMMKGLYRTVFSLVMSPRRYGRAVQLTWKLNYDSGWFENIEMAPKKHQGVVHEWAGHHPFLCRMNVAAKAAIYEVMDCERVVVERSCKSDGGTWCGSVITWE